MSSEEYFLRDFASLESCLLFQPNQDEDHEAGEAHPPHENHAENQVNPNNVDEAKDED